MSTNAAIIVLTLTILNGFFAIFIAIRLKATHPTHPRIARYLFRGILSIILGALTLSLFWSGAVNVWTALLSVSFLLMLGEYLLAAREKRQLIGKGLYDPAELEAKEQQEREKVKAKGQRRYVWENVLIYGLGGFLLIAALDL